MPTDRRAGTKQGPYVYGGKQPRARNRDGSWRKKRSDDGTIRAGTDELHEIPIILVAVFAFAALAGLVAIATRGQTDPDLR